jgi:hypothetical protein
MDRFGPIRADSLRLWPTSLNNSPALTCSNATPGGVVLCSKWGYFDVGDRRMLPTRLFVVSLLHLPIIARHLKHHAML